MAALALLVARRADAYPWMIRHDYTACASCHVDPSGAGIMTLYGRAQSEILLRTRYGETREDEDPAKLGAFFFGAVPLPEPLLLQADARTMFMHVVPPAPAPPISRVILMQADAAGALVAGPLRASGTLGYVHEGALGASITRGSEDRLISRQHWVGLALGEDDAWLVRAGRMNLPYGLRILEHTTFVRQATRTDINAAQQHGLALAYDTEGWRAEAMAIAGNLQLAPDALRDRGGAAYVERALSQKLAIGATSLVTHAELDLEAGRAAFRQSHGLFGRWALSRAVVLMAEADALVLSPKRRSMSLGGAGLLSLDVEPIQGVHVGGAAEALATDLDAPMSVGAWLSAFWFFLPHVDVRADVVLRDVPAGDDRVTVPTLLAQLHGFL